MTAKSIYEAVLTELNKLLAPSITLEDFNHFFNKAINLFINKKYNIYDVNQLSTDDLRVLKSTTILTPVRASVYTDNTEGDLTMLRSLYGATYEINLPDDYLHILNCVCVYKVNSNYKCYDAGDYVLFGATRLVADAWSTILNNFYMKPSYKRPYYYIHNVNTYKNVSTNPIVLDTNGLILSGTDYSENTPSTENVLYVYHEWPHTYDATTKTNITTPPPKYEFSQERLKDMAKTVITNPIKVTLDKALTYLLILPENVLVKSITEEVTQDLTGLFTHRKYAINRPVTITSGNSVQHYKLIFLGDGSPISGNYTITLTT